MIASRFPRLVLLVGLLLVAPRTVSILPAAAATTSAAFLVTSTTDAPDAAPGDGLCASTADGACTVRAAIQEADAQPAGSTVHVTLPAGHYLLTLGELDLITNTVVISGAGARRTVVDAGGRSRALHVFPHSRVWLGLVTVTGGQAGFSAPYGDVGGGILNAGQVAVVESSVSDNASSSSGGGIYNLGTVTLTSSTVGGNTTLSEGGGVTNHGVVTLMTSTVISNTATDTGGSDGGGIANYGAVTVTNSALISNTAYYGGGIFNVSFGTVRLSQSILRGNSGYIGGGIENAGSVTLTSSTVVNNNGFEGGGLHNFNMMTVTNSSIISNTATNDGGGLANSALVTLTTSLIQGNAAVLPGSDGGGLSNFGTMTLSHSAVVSNTATSRGGGIANRSGRLRVTNSTISGNVATLGGAIAVDAPCCSSVPPWVVIAYSTLSNNTATQGGGLASDPGTPVAVLGTILAQNTPSSCAGTLPTEGDGYNLDSGVSCGLSRTTDLTATHALLGPLTANGGPTPTQALLPGSPAIDHGGASATGCPATDQRGVSRPQGASCDMGAYERVSALAERASPVVPVRSVGGGLLSSPPCGCSPTDAFLSLAAAW